ADALRALMTDLESDRVERTVSVNKTDKFCRAICAFANDFPGHGRPGYLLVGVHDDGRPSGLEVTDRLLLNLGGLRTDGNIQPIPSMTVTKVVLPEGEIAVVEVLPSLMPPVRYDGRIHIRVGPRRAIASEQEERILTERRVSAARSFDLTPCLDATLDDLSLELFASYRARAVSPETIEQNNRPIEQQLAALRFYDLRHRAPTHAGILLFGKDPRAWLPGAYVQFLQVDGATLADDVVGEQEMSGDLSSLLRQLDLVTGLHIRQRPVPVPDSVLREQTARTYPASALRELLLNAVMHRSYQSHGPIRYYWYRDHVEIQSPGGLYGDATPDNFPDRNDYRNPVLAEAMKVLGYVNKYGRGVVRAQAELERNGNPEATFRFDPGFVQVTLRATS
ncbi:MAG: putative DNA binding domain-containing protein, partial [Myxococcales bacterium]|nr:putative DNA binding domain-containing protein [Myxococcales bacterium]